MRITPLISALVSKQDKTRSHFKTLRKTIMKQGDIKERAVNRERALIAKNQMAAVDGNESAKVEDLRPERVESTRPG